jgi:hypothetical protein
MTALVSVETVLLVVLVVLVAGLLRSHAEILRRLGASESDVPAPGTRARTGTDAPAIAGQTLEGDPVKLDFAAGGAPKLLAFLSTGCSVCEGFWGSMDERRLPGGVEPLIVTHGEARESPARLRKLAPQTVPIVMSEGAWEDYGVPGSPYFVLVEGTVRGEGAASTWEAVASLVGDAIEDAAARPGSGPERAQRIDQRFAVAGIGPDDPSLYPGND